VPKFSTDSTGLIIDLPAVNTPYAALLQGTLTFGIGSQTNNTKAAATPVLTVASGSRGLSTRFADKTFPTSFLDTGSNGIFFDSAGTLAACNSLVVGFYCPNTLTPLSATLTGANGQTFAVTFSVDHAWSLFSSALPVLPHLAGDLPDLTAFDWGLPFFFGRRVYFGIEDATGSGAYVAFEAAKN
jgi:hypothetical protein